MCKGISRFVGRVLNSPIFFKWLTIGFLLFLTVACVDFATDVNVAIDIAQKHKDYTNFLHDGGKIHYGYLKSTHGAQQEFIIQPSILQETAIYSPSNFLHYTIASQNVVVNLSFGQQSGKVDCVIQRTRPWKNDRRAKSDIGGQTGFGYGFEMKNIMVVDGTTLGDASKMTIDVQFMEDLRLFSRLLKKVQEKLRQISQSPRTQDLIQRLNRRRTQSASGEAVPFSRLRLGAGGQPY